ncbi:MAG: hypothetical protein MJ240_11175 [Kiritimatiellae bacterium]|nr:hypothetical protein [Kiritimatiellia bacterium]
MKRRDFVKLGALAACAPSKGVFGGEAQPVRLGFITDCHYAAHRLPAAGDRRNYAGGLAKMQAFVAAMNAAGVDFVVEGGDFKDLGGTPAESLAYLDAMEGAFAQFRGPRHHVLGNHDHDNISKEEFLGHIANAGQERAQAYYSFDVRGIRFIVLDACYRADGTPYCRGNFSWKEAFLPPEQVAFLRAALASAPGPCVPILHQQLDAEDETCVRNAAEVRAILEASGKVKCVLQGHYHESAFREVNGIGYYTLAANVMGQDNAYSVVTVSAQGEVTIVGHGGAASCSRQADGSWRADAAWRPGHYQVHFIYTGRGEAMLHIFPDGTTMMVDCGDSMRFQGTPQEVPLLPDCSRRSGEWAARYVARVNPRGSQVDYFHLSHYHEDHGGGERYHGGVIASETGNFHLCGLADAARFLTFGKLVDRASPTFDDPLDVLASSRDGTPRNMRALYAHLKATQGTAIERFQLGAHDQFRALHGTAKDFSVFNLCVNGRYVRKDGSIADIYADRVKAGAKNLNENGLSCGFIVSYGKFRLYSAGDFSDVLKATDGSRICTEDIIAEALGPVDVAKVNHHGHHAMYSGLVKALQARVWTACVLDQLHMTDDTCSRLADRSLYRGARTILPEYMPLQRPLLPEGRGYLAEVPMVVRQQPCHLVLDVPEGGETYSITCLSAADEANRLKARFGFFSRGGWTSKWM